MSFTKIKGFQIDTNEVVSFQTLNDRVPFAIQTLTFSSNIIIDFSISRNFQITLTGNITIQNPVNAITGHSGLIYLIQDSTGNRTASFGTNWKFENGTAPTLTTSANAMDMLVYEVYNSNFIVATLLKDIRS